MSDCVTEQTRTETFRSDAHVGLLVFDTTGIICLSRLHDDVNIDRFFFFVLWSLTEQCIFTNVFMVI